MNSYWQVFTNSPESRNIKVIGIQYYRGVEFVNNLEVENILRYPENYLQNEGKTLDSRLNEIKINNQQEKQIIKDKTIKTVRDKSLSLFGNVGEIISTVLNWSDEIENDLTEAKKTALMEQYFNKVDNVEHATGKIKEFLTNPQGFTIYCKVLRILDEYPPDLSLMDHLSDALKYIIEKGEFEKLFERHKFVLSQIEILTPQSLTILADNKNWPFIEVTGAVFINGKLNSPWSEEFASVYCLKKSIFDQDKVNRVIHSILELDRLGFIEVYQCENNRFGCKLTRVGKDLIYYI